MEMTYDGVLVMPNNYVVVNEEEMTYVEGGATYRGWKALNEIANMAFVVLGYVTTASTLCAVLGGGLVASGTGVGCVVAFAAAIGLGWCAALGSWNAVMLGLAIFNYVKYRGFSQTSTTILGCTLYTSVGKP